QNNSGADVYVKLESANPSRSVKDRAAFNMIVEAEKANYLKPGSTIIEPTSGNTGIGLAMNAAARGYNAIFVMPDNATTERIQLMKTYGAQVVIIRSAYMISRSIKISQKVVSEIEYRVSKIQSENNTNAKTQRGIASKDIIDATRGLDRSLVAFVCSL